MLAQRKGDDVNNKASDPGKMFGINFMKRKKNFLIKFTFNGSNSCLYVVATVIINQGF